MNDENIQPSESVRERLLQAALTHFLEDDFYSVSTRQLAQTANANISMIRYYFGNKEGLYEEMIRSIMAPIFTALESQTQDATKDFTDLLKLYYSTMTKHPEFPKLILKILALNQAPGKRFVQQLLERGRSQGAQQVNALKNSGKVDSSIDPDILRMSFVSLAITPMLLKDIYEEQLDKAIDIEFLQELAKFNGRLLAAAIET